MKKRWMALLAVVMAFIMVTSACSKKEASTSEATSSTEEQSSEETAEESSVEESSEASEESSEAIEGPDMETINAGLSTTMGEIGKEAEASEESGSEEPEEAFTGTRLETSINFVRGGLLPEIVEVDPETLTEDQEAEMNRAMRAYVPGVGDEIVNNATHFYFYEQMTPEQQDIYDALLLLGSDPTTTNNIVTLYTDVDPRSAEFVDDFYLVWLCFGYDHPEMWWMNYWNGKYAVDAYIGQPQNGHNTVMFQMNEAYTDFEKDVTAWNDAVEAFMADIDQTASQEEMALAVHDKLINLAKYDNETLSRLNDKDNAGDLAHTAFGAFVHNTAGDPNYCVCDGYSEAYTYILQQLEFEVTVVSGIAGSGSNKGGHAWSIVKIDDMWYEVDSTWDDQTELRQQIEDQFTPDSLEYKYYTEAVDDAAYMDKISHYLYKLTTAEIEDYTITDDLYYTTKDGLYQFPLVGDSQRVRYCDDSAMSTTLQGTLTSLLPLADGTLSPASTEISDEYDIAGTYYVSKYNNYDQAALAAAKGEEYYKLLTMFDLNKDGTGRMYQGQDSINFTYTFDGTTLTLMGAGGGVVEMTYDEATGVFSLMGDSQNYFEFSRL